MRLIVSLILILCLVGCASTSTPSLSNKTGTALISASNKIAPFGVVEFGQVAGGPIGAIAAITITSPVWLLSIALYYAGCALGGDQYY